MIAGEFVSQGRRGKKREAPGRITSASLTAQSRLTVPHWITSFSTQNVDAQIIKPFFRTGYREFRPCRYLRGKRKEIEEWPGDCVEDRKFPCCPAKGVASGHAAIAGTSQEMVTRT